MLQNEFQGCMCLPSVCEYAFTYLSGKKLCMTMIDEDNDGDMNAKCVLVKEFT